MNYNRVVMKQEVKQAMRRTRPHPMLVSLLYLALAGTGAWLISWLVNVLFPGANALLNALAASIQYYGEEYLEYVLEERPEMLVLLAAQVGMVSFAVGILTIIWNGLMGVGYAGYCLDMSRGTNAQPGRIFSGFSYAGSVILAYILVAVFTSLWTLLFGLVFGVLVGIAVVLATISDALAILSFFLIFLVSIPYAVAIIWVVYRYAMVPFIIADSQEPPSAMDVIRTSKTIMKGRKGDYFVLQISFIGWYLLEYLVLMAGFMVSIFTSILFYAGDIYDMEYMLEDIISYGDLEAAAQLLAPALPIVLLCMAAIFIINLWLTPYRTGCEARFYMDITGGQPSPYQPGLYQPGSYQSGPYHNDPYGYTPPSQTSYSGYTQTEQPPRHGTGTYTQWSAPQTPQSPAPEAPEIPAEPTDAPYEEPYAEPETSDDDTLN